MNFLLFILTLLFLTQIECLTLRKDRDKILDDNSLQDTVTKEEGEESIEKREAKVDDSNKINETDQGTNEVKATAVKETKANKLEEKRERSYFRLPVDNDTGRARTKKSADSQYCIQTNGYSSPTVCGTLVSIRGPDANQLPEGISLQSEMDHPFNQPVVGAICADTPTDTITINGESYKRVSSNDYTQRSYGYQNAGVATGYAYPYVSSPFMFHQNLHSQYTPNQNPAPTLTPSPILSSLLSVIQRPTIPSLQNILHPSLGNFRPTAVPSQSKSVTMKCDPNPTSGSNTFTCTMQTTNINKLSNSFSQSKKNSLLDDESDLDDMNITDIRSPEVAKKIQKELQDLRTATKELFHQQIRLAEVQQLRMVEDEMRAQQEISPSLMTDSQGRTFAMPSNWMVQQPAFYQTPSQRYFPTSPFATQKSSETSESDCFMKMIDVALKLGLIPANLAGRNSPEKRNMGKGRSETEEITVEDINISDEDEDESEDKVDVKATKAVESPKTKQNGDRRPSKGNIESSKFSPEDHQVLSDATNRDVNLDTSNKRKAHHHDYSKSKTVSLD